MQALMQPITSTHHNTLQSCYLERIETKTSGKGLGNARRRDSSNVINRMQDCRIELRVLGFSIFEHSLYHYIVLVF